MKTDTFISFADYSIVTESLNLEVGEVHRDPSLEAMVKMMLHPATHPSVKVMYNAHMDDNNLRLIKFKNTEGQVEYHIHNTMMMPGLKSSNTSKLGFLSAAKLIHDDGVKELENGNTLRFQSLEGSDQHAKYVNMIDRIAKKAGRTVTHKGVHPITSAPFLTGEVMLIEHTDSSA